MRDYNTISALFGNQNQSSGLVNFSDYASIKNGSYGKLLKAYYEKDTASSEDKKVKAEKNDTVKKTKLDTENTKLSKIKTNADSLMEDAKKLDDDKLWTKDANGDVDMDKISKNVASFVKSYNTLIDSTSKAESNTVNDSVKWMSSLTDVMKNQLSKVGISIDSDNKLKLDEDALKKSDVKSLKTLFDGKNSYANEISSKASAVASAAVNSSSMYSSDGKVNSSLQGLFNQFI